MKKEEKSNIIPFPLEKRIAQISEEDFFLKASNQYDDSVCLARHCIDLIGEWIPNQDFIDPGFIFNPAENPQQHADMFVLLNLLVASFLRNSDIRHILQDDLDGLLEKIQYLESENFDPTTK
jgi:hypothetical protein